MSYSNSPGLGGLEGNIALDNESDPQSAGIEEAKNGFQPENQNANSNPNMIADDLNTLDEPVMDTIVRNYSKANCDSLNLETRSVQNMVETQNSHESICQSR